MRVLLLIAAVFDVKIYIEISVALGMASKGKILPSYSFQCESCGYKNKDEPYKIECGLDFWNFTIEDYRVATDRCESPIEDAVADKFREITKKYRIHGLIFLILVCLSTATMVV